MRFIKEYAHWKKQHIKYLPEDERNDTCKRIDKAVKLRERGFITVDETMKVIMEA